MKGVKGRDGERSKKGGPVGMQGREEEDRWEGSGGEREERKGNMTGSSQ